MRTLLLVLLLLASGCAHKRVMKNCEPIGTQNYLECEEP